MCSNCSICVRMRTIHVIIIGLLKLIRVPYNKTIALLTSPLLIMWRRSSGRKL